VQVDPQFGTGLGPDEAVQEALYDAIEQMQKAIINSGEVRAQMKYYKQADDARRQREYQV